VFDSVARLAGNFFFPLHALDKGFQMKDLFFTKSGDNMNLIIIGEIGNLDRDIGKINGVGSNVN